MPIYYYHCTDGRDLLIDRSGGRAGNRDQMRRQARAFAGRIMSELPSYGGWASWVVSIHDEAGRLVDTIGFPTSTITSKRRSRHGTEVRHSLDPDRPRAVSLHRH